MRPLTLFVLVVGVACLVAANEEDAAAEETPVEPEEDHVAAGNNTVVLPPEAEHEPEAEADPTPAPGAAPETANKGDDNGARLLTSSFLAVLSAVTLHAVLV